jgi:hypothetical protein
MPHEYDWTKQSIAIICLILIMYWHFLFADDQVIQDLPMQLDVSDTTVEGEVVYVHEPTPKFQ